MDPGDGTWEGKPFCRGKKGFLHANVPKSYEACEYCGLANPDPQSICLPTRNLSVPIIDLVNAMITIISHAKLYIVHPLLDSGLSMSLLLNKHELLQ
jgi:hypothetical protein